jgi:hypothetical protein
MSHGAGRSSRIAAVSERRRQPIEMQVTAAAAAGNGMAAAVASVVAAAAAVVTSASTRWLGAAMQYRKVLAQVHPVQLKVFVTSWAMSREVALVQGILR